MRKVLIASMAMLVLVLGLGLVPAIPSAQAADICVSKDTVPGSPHEYHIGDTIEYVITVQNPNDTHSMTVDVWDELPPYGDNPNPADIIMLDDDATFAPGETRTYNVSYVVKAADMEQLEVDGTLYNVVVNALRVHGTQHHGLIDVEVTKPSIVIQPNTVTTIWSDKEMVHAGDNVTLTISEENTGDVSLTGAYVELFADNTSIDILDYSTAVPSGGNSDNILDPGETWTWTVEPSVTDDTTFIAVGHGWDPTGLDITYDNCFKSERDEITIDVISPGTEVSITSNKSEVYQGESFTLTISETNTGEEELTGVYVELFADGSSIATLDASTASPSGGNGDDVLDPGETWTWTVNRTINATTTFVAIGHGIDPLGLDVTFENGFEEERDEVTVHVICINPDTLVTITSDAYVVHSGEEVELTISEENTGDVSLTNVFVELFADGDQIDTLTHASAIPSGGNDDDVLDPGEIWTWTVNRTITEDTTFVAIGHGLDPTGLDITYENCFKGERDEITIDVISPGTEVNISCVDDKVWLTITETNTGDAPLTDAYVELFANGTTVAILDASSAIPSGGNDDDVLDPGETWTWTWTQCISETTTFVAIGHGMDPTGLDITYDNGFLDERDQVTIRLICVSPNTLVTITTNDDEVPAGESVDLTISERNTGCVSLTGAHVELFANGTLIETLTFSSATPSGGNSDDVLDPGETWTWTLARSIDATTTFVAIGHGIDPGGLDITYPQFPDERDEVTVHVIGINPDTLVTMTSDKYMVQAGEGVELTISEENTGDVPLTNVYVELFYDDAIETLDYSTATPSGGNSDNVLDPGETWTWTVTIGITADTTFVAVGHGTDPTGLDITHDNGFEQERDEVTITVISPGTDVSITADCHQVYKGESAVLTISETNIGEESLTDAYVELFANDVSIATLDYSTATPSGGDDDDVLDPGETWTWTVNRTINVTTTFVAIGHGMTPTDLDVTYDNGFLDERDEVTVELLPCGEATRTLGFWKTHYAYTSHVFTNHLDGETIDLGWTQLQTADHVIGMLWANVAGDSTGAKRSQLCQARVIASHQAVAAILNCGLENGAPLPVSWDDIKDILSGSDIAAIKALGEQLDYYNNSGDDVDIVDSDSYALMSATPQLGKSIDVSIADCSSESDGAPATSADASGAEDGKGETTRADLSPAFYGLAALAAGLAILVPVRMLRSRKRGNQ